MVKRIKHIYFELLRNKEIPKNYIKFYLKYKRIYSINTYKVAMIRLLYWKKEPIYKIMERFKLRSFYVFMLIVEPLIFYELNNAPHDFKKKVEIIKALRTNEQGSIWKILLKYDLQIPFKLNFKRFKFKKFSKYIHYLKYLLNLHNIKLFEIGKIEFD